MNKLQDTLPNTADEIADYLMFLGFKGMHNCPYDCPDDRKQVYFDIEDSQILFEKVYGTQAMLEFSLNFNEGKYPGMVK